MTIQLKCFHDSLNIVVILAPSHDFFFFFFFFVAKSAQFTLTLDKIK